jgi:hypothetical protein
MHWSEVEVVQERDVTGVTGPTVFTDAVYDYMQAHVSGGGGGHHGGGTQPRAPQNVCTCTACTVSRLQHRGRYFYQ